MVTTIQKENAKKKLITEIKFLAVEIIGNRSSVKNNIGVIKQNRKKGVLRLSAHLALRPSTLPPDRAKADKKLSERPKKGKERERERKEERDVERKGERERG